MPAVPRQYFAHIACQAERRRVEKARPPLDIRGPFGYYTCAMQRAFSEKSTASVLLCGPAVFLYLAFFALPTLLGFAYGLTDWSGWTKDPRFIGLDNFRALIDDWEAGRQGSK